MTLYIDADEDFITIKRVMVKDIIHLVCREENISLGILISPQKTEKVMLARDIARYLACMLSGKSLMVIGRIFNNHHTSVIHARKKITEQRLIDPVLDEKIKRYEFLLST